MLWMLRCIRLCRSFGVRTRAKVYIANSVAMRCQKALLKAAYDSYNFTGLRVRSVELV